MTDLFEDIEIVDPPFVLPDDPAPDGPACEECGTLIEWSGRGRKPKRCAEHKTRTTARASASGAPRRGAKLEATLSQLEADLTTEFALFGKTTAKALPTFGVTAARRAEKTAQALCKIAATNNNVLNALLVATKIVPALDIGETVLCLGVALLVDLNRIPPDGVLPTVTGVSDTWHEIHDDDVDAPIPYTPTDTSSHGVRVPPRFAVMTP